MKTYTFTYFLQKAAEISADIDNNIIDDRKIRLLINDIDYAFRIDHDLNSYEYDTCKNVLRSLEDNRYFVELYNRS